MDTTVMRCPSGLRGRIRKLKGKDFHRQIIVNADENTPDQMADLASMIWVETIDPGPYRKLQPGQPPAFKTDVLLGDRTAALLKARVLTDGGKRQHRIQCDVCKRYASDEFDYGAMDMREWPDDDNVSEDSPLYKAWNARRQFTAGEQCSTAMPDGTIIRWDLLTGALLTSRIREFAVQFGDSYYADTAARIVSIDGIELPSDPKTRRSKIFETLTEYDDPDFWHLWNDIQDHEVGPETEVPKVCPYDNCGATFGYAVDILGFIMPPPPKRWKRFQAGARSRMQVT